VNWLAPILSPAEARRRKWREAQRRHRSGSSMSRRQAVQVATKFNRKRAA
jgi:hypothetical protein